MPTPVTTSSTSSTTNTTTRTEPDGTVVRGTTTTTVSNGRVMEKDVKTTYSLSDSVSGEGCVTSADPVLARFRTQGGVKSAAV